MGYQDFLIAVFVISFFYYLIQFLIDRYLSLRVLDSNLYLQKTALRLLWSIVLASVLYAFSFFLHTQILYFKMGNAAITKDAANPEASNVKNLLNDNEQIVVNNFHNYLGYLSSEEALDETALKKGIQVLEVYYPKLIEEFQTANYNKIKDTSLALSKKVKSIYV